MLGSTSLSSPTLAPSVLLRISPYSFGTAYSLGYATGQLLLPFVCLMASVILIRDSLASYVSAESAAREL